MPAVFAFRYLATKASQAQNKPPSIFACFPPAAFYHQPEWYSIDGNVHLP